MVVYETEITSKIYDLINQVLISGICSLVIIGLLIKNKNNLFLYSLLPFVAFMVIRTKELQQLLFEEENRVQRNGAREEKTWSTILSEIALLLISQIIICIIYVYFFIYPNRVFIITAFIIAIFNLLFIIYKWPMSGWNIGIICLFIIAKILIRKV